MGRSTVHYTDSKTNTILKALHNKLRPAGTPVQRVEYIIELLLLRIFEVKLKREDEFKQLRKLFTHEAGKDNDKKLFYYLQTVGSEKILSELNKNFFPFYADILNHARKVIKGNLTTKVQDQLVLIQDVFANSNFTNNVQSGNLEEIINLVAEIDEERLLNTDLLGDAIESALSETGGTKDIGLFRTPDHVRQFMVGTLQPKITDNIFDPACGTGGFLFDSYGFVIESFKQDGDWPGPKAHPEMQDWFKKYFKKNAAAMPTVEQTQQFYRSGIFGIEYLGMIRKMAMVNMFVKGLNPHNIEPGDSLAKFNKELQFKDSFSMVLANPPFGAERDQKAYPNVWEEFSKESETTILFVKLMLDALKPGGRCAVVVSEGFLTWPHTSAKALRHMLLTEANLLAVIGLPGGVFVSKSGQGPKTSILVFEKGTAPTQNVWFYNVENDGYTKGTNRTPIDGCQLPEALDLFHTFVRRGKIPPETRNSFSLSVDWISVVDPRIKEKIRAEVTADIEQKKQIAKTKLIERLDKKKQTTKKSKAAAFGKKQADAEMYKFECVWQQKLQNEIAKCIDKAHDYSLNSATYRSSLTEIQLADWDKAVSGHKPEKNGHSLDKRFALLKQSKLDNAIKQIAAFDPQNAIEADIVREYLAGIEPQTLKKYPALKTIDDIFKSGAKYPMVKLKDVCTYEKGKFPTEKTPSGPYPFVVTAAERRSADASQFEGNAVCIPLISSTGHGHASMNRIHYQEGKFALANLLFALFAKDETRLNMKYLYHILVPKLDELFVPLMKGAANVSMKMDDAVEVKFPLPPLDKQIEIVEQLEKQNAVIEGADKIVENYFFHADDLFGKYPLKKIGNYISEISLRNKRNHTLPVVLVSKNYGMMLSEEYFSNRTNKKVYSDDLTTYKIIKKDQFAYSGIHANEGAIGFLKDLDEALISGIYRVFEVDCNKVEPLYLNAILKSQKALNYYNQATTGAIERRTNLPFDYFCEFHIPLPDIEIQKNIAENILDKEQTLKRLSALKDETIVICDDIIYSMWED